MSDKAAENIRSEFEKGEWRKFQPRDNFAYLDYETFSAWPIYKSGFIAGQNALRDIQEALSCDYAHLGARKAMRIIEEALGEIKYTHDQGVL